MLLKKHSVFFSWLLSYILMLFVPIFFGIAVYEKAEKTVEYEISHSSRIMLEQVQQAMDGGLQDINRFINQVELNKRIKQLVNINRNETLNYYDDNVLQVLDDFKYYRVLTSYINDYFIYIKDIDKIVSGSALIDQDIFYKSKMKNGSGNGTISREKWDMLIQGGYIGEYIVLDVSGISADDTRKEIIYSVNLPLNQNENSKSTLVIFLNYKKIQGIIQSIQTANNGLGIILDKDNRLLFSTMNLNTLPTEIRYENLVDGKDTVNMTINGSRSVVSHINSREAGWKYISVIPYSIFWQKVESIRLLTAICTILCIIFGIYASYYLARKNYMQVNNLLSYLMGKTRIALTKGFNEYKFIQEAVTKTINENQNMSERLRQQSQTLRLIFLGKLLKGKIEDPILITNALSMYNLKFESDFFAVVIFYIVDFETLFEKQYSEKTSEEKLTLVQFIITNVFEELAAQENNGYMTEVDGMLACLINFRNPENGRQKLLRAVHEANDFIRNKFGIKFVAAVSDIHKTYLGIPEAYHEALDTIEYQIAMENGEIMCYSDIKGFNGKYNYSIEMENRLINCIKAGDYEKSRNILNEIFDINFSGNYLPNSLVKCLMFGLANTMLKAMMEISYICGEGLIEELHIEDRLLKCDKVNEMKIQLTDMLKNVCNYIQHNRKGRRDQLVDGIIAYIENNYSDASLSVANIAKGFDLTPTYLTKLFKEQTAEGIFDYISRIRIEKAKIILKSQADLNIKDIAEEVGYLNSNIFIRAFKKQEGITPGVYKVS